MSNIEYLSLKQVKSEDLIAVVNESALRTHLVNHPYFNTTSIQTWIDDKIKIDSLQKCRVRAVFIDKALAGWCGIQPDDNGFEIAIVISQRFWGSGIAIFKTLMSWAAELGHKEVLFHLLDSRREYKILKKMSTKVVKTELLGRHFTSYYFTVGDKTYKR